MGLWQNFWNRMRGGKSDQQLLQELSQVVMEITKESGEIYNQLSDLRANWNALSKEERLRRWQQLHQLVRKHEQEEQLLKALEEQLNTARKRSILKEAQDKAAQLG